MLILRDNIFFYDDEGVNELLELLIKSKYQIQVNYLIGDKIIHPEKNINISLSLLKRFPTEVGYYFLAGEKSIRLFNVKNRKDKLKLL
jgi:hypothetical protein